jgi:proteasome lid subunit RPN8/RPN11
VFEIPPSRRLELLRLAASDPTREVAALLGCTPSGQVVSVIPCQNVSPRPDVAFQLDPREVGGVVASFLNAGLELGGIFHSHVTGTHKPSKADRRLFAAYPQIVLVITPLTVDPPTLACWQETDHGTAEPLVVYQAQLPRRAQEPPA